MEMKQDKLMKTLQCILWSMLVAVVLFLIVGELVMPREDGTGGHEAALFEAEWERVLPDGTFETVTLPGECDAGKGEVVRIETTLPADQKDIWMCARASMQDMKIYVGDELRKEYTTKDTRPFGINSASAYVFFPVTEEDAGQVLAIETVSESIYSGILNEVYMGDRDNIWGMFLSRYMLVAIVSLFMLILSLITIAYSAVLRRLYKMDMDIAYLGHGLFLASLWLFCNSRIRQFFLPNMSIASAVGFLVVMLLPYPYLVYINLVQKKRYQKFYLAIAFAAILNFTVSVIVQLLNVKDFFDIMLSSHLVIAMVVIVCAVTTILDVLSGAVADYKEVALGFIGLIIAAIWEVLLVYRPTSNYSGLVLCIGLTILLFTAALKTGRDMMMAENEKQMAIVAGESKAKFLANMSHEIRTPINTVIGMNEMILRENKDQTVREYAENIHNSSQLLLGLINDILDFSKIEAGKLDIIVTDYHLSKMLIGVIQGLRYKAENSKLDIVLDIEESLPSVLRGDEIRIRQILNNLLANALKYTKEGTITLKVRGEYTAKGFELHMSVKDTGIGIRKEDIPYLFDSFQRMEEKKNRHIEGTGLGLSITKQLIDLMNGEINVQSEYGTGSCFTVCIPQQVVDGSAIGKLEEAYKRDNAKKEEEEQKEFKMTLYAPKVRILAVDDTKMNLFVVKSLLKRTAIQLDLASGGNECLELCRKNEYDLILMDHMMPEPDGIETLHLLRAEEGPNQKTKVVVLTANAISGVREKYIEEGFHDYLAKPLLG
nr:response regulator [Lachnospiraceae bacterium]